jgi:thymidylate kinase
MSRQWPDTAYRDNKGCWISIDGVDGVGKTVLAQHLVTVLDGATLVPEFSQSLEGAYLQDAVTRGGPRFPSLSRMEKSLLFLADFFRQYDTLIRRALQQGRIAISDRGYVSKYVFQLLVLSYDYDPAAVEAMLDALFRLIAPPDLTLYLTCEEHACLQRLIQRDGRCDSVRVSFIRQAKQAYLRYLQSHPLRYAQIDQDGQQSKEDILRRGEEAVKTFLADREAQRVRDTESLLSEH